MTYIPRLAITQSGIRKIKAGNGNESSDYRCRKESSLHIAGDLYRLGYQISGFIPEDDTTPVLVERNEIAGDYMICHRS